MMKFLHCADIHLDSPFTLRSPDEAGKRRTELRSDFCSAVLYAKTEGCTAFFIAGDLFDDSFVTKDTMEMLAHEFAAFPSCHFFITPGNHDYYYDKSPYALTAWSDNVHIFSSPALSYVDIPGTDVRVYGYGFTCDTLNISPLAGFHVHDESKVNVLVAHADFGSTLSPYAPLPESDLARSGFAYAALGHIHKASELKYAGKTAYAYSGCLEGRGFDETGYKGALLGEIDAQSLKLRPVRFCKKRYEVCRVDVTGATSLSGAAAHILEACAAYGADTALRVILEGITAPEFSAGTEELRTLLPTPYLLEVRDNTLPLYQTESLKNDNTLVGEFYRNLEPSLTAEDAGVRATAHRALKYGLKALYGREL